MEPRLVDELLERLRRAGEAVLADVEVHAGPRFPGPAGRLVGKTEG
jgi:hypothetical protein